MMPVMANYLRDLWRHDRAGLIRVGALMVLVSLGEGVGLMLLLPLLALLGIGGPEPASGGVAGHAADVAAWLDFSFTLESVLLVYLFIIGAHSFFAYRRDLESARLRLRFVDQLRCDLFGAIARADWPFITRTHSSEFTHVLTSDINRIGQGTYNLLTFGSQACLGLAYVTVSLIVSPIVTLLAGAAGSLLLLMMRSHHRKTLELGAQLSTAGQALYRTLTEHQGGIKVAKSFGAEQRHIDDFKRVINDLRERQMDFFRSNGRTRMWFKTGSAAALSLVVYQAVGSGQVDSLRLLVLVVVFARLLPLFSSLQQTYQQLLYMIPAYRTTQALRERCERAAEAPLPVSIADCPGFRERIRLENVCFRYAPSGDRDVLAGLNLDLDIFSTTALVGPSGAGKSTVADLLMGLLRPTSGTLSLDRLPLEDACVPVWRRQVAYVPQETYLFADSVRNNLLWARPDASEAEVREVLEIAAAVDFVGRLPDGLDTVVGERGVRLSGGERQRLALARALLRRPKLLILDEATSSLDSESEARIKVALRGLHGKLTILVIAHRLGTVRDADKICVLEEGRITESGTWEELTARTDGPLQRLLKADGGNVE